MKLDDTDLVKHFRTLGMEDRDIIHLASQMSFPEIILPQFLSNHIKHNAPEKFSVGGLKDNIQLSAYLDFLQRDFISEICGESRPLSTLNYFLTLALCHLLFMAIEDRLKACGNSTWNEAYEGNCKWTKQKRASLTALALKEDDPELLEILAEEFEKQRCGFMDYIYWDDLLTREDIEKAVSSDQTAIATEVCMVM